MSRINRFEDIKAWQEGRNLKKIVYKIINKPKVKNNFSFCDQIQRATTSIMSNIAEGFESQTKMEFIKFLYYAKRSAAEVRSQVYEALDQNYVDNNEFDEVYKQVVYVRNLLSKFITYLKTGALRQG